MSLPHMVNTLVPPQTEKDNSKQKLMGDEDSQESPRSIKS